MKSFITSKGLCSMKRENSYSKTMLTLIFVFFVIASYGQYGRFEPGGYIGISGGLASPSSNLAMKSFERSNSGYALNGMNFNISFAYKLFQEKYGVSSMLSYSSMPIDIDALQNDISTIDSISGAVISANNKQEVVIASLMAGAYAQFRLLRKTYINLRLMVGPSQFSFPKYTANLSNGTTIDIKDGYKKVAVSYDFGICFKYMLTTSLYLLGDIDFFTSKFEVDGIKIMTNEGIYHYDKVNQQASSNNVTVGIGFFLDK